jgi:urea carboxylase
MFKKVLIANRGEIAVRIARTLEKMGVPSVAVYSDADRDSLHVTAADEAVAIGPAAPSASYLNVEAILKAARDTGADAIIPGYGFLSENATFAEACEAAGIAFVGPTPDQMRRFGLKHAAREIAEAAGVPLAPGTKLLKSLDDALEAAGRIGYPLMLKSTAGGGGIGLKRCNDEAELVDAFETVKRMGASFFNDAGVFLERFIDRARHVEVQIFGDGRGKVVALGERDCSIQRRNQKVIEETPAPKLPAATRDALLAAAVALGEAVSYRSAGTVEFVYDEAADVFYFLEVNTRLQVEHPITEAVTRLDLVEWMIRIAAGEPVVLERPPLRGAAIEVRLYAEDPSRNFQPSPGTLTEVVFPTDARIDTWVATGTEVTPNYDPMLAKIIVHGTDRADALKRLRHALAATRISGIATNLDYLQAILASKSFGAGDVSTQFLATFDYEPATIEVVAPGTYTTVQDYPGRVGYWDIGVPPSGPMDDFAFRLANRIVGNHRSAAALECTIMGPTLKFHSDAVIALTGAPTPATLDSEPVAFNQPISITAGQTLTIGRATSGCRTYLAIRDGLDVPVYLGSKSTFALGQFGGHAGRPLRAQDQLKLVSGMSPDAREVAHAPLPTDSAQAAPASMVASYPTRWAIGCLIGPHSAPDFFTEDAVETFFATDWAVHYNSNRLGIRLVGPKPTWTRSDGGEAGLHPSNVHDCEYAIGSVNFTGDMPVILTRDGPSLGGFVCPVTIAKGELWKVGQVKPGDTIRFMRMSFDAALALEEAQDVALETLVCPNGATLGLKTEAPPIATNSKPISTKPIPVADAILVSLPATTTTPKVVYRQAGDRYILIEYGENILDLNFRFRIHALMEELKASPVPGILELSPGVRSLQVNYDSRIVTQRALVEALLEAESRLPRVDEMRVDTRVIHLPMTFEDSATLDAVARYRQSVRDKAPWLPRNAEFMRRINGLDSVDEVSDIIFKASYMVLGLGDVYLGAPCAVPVDPRHRLLTSKYNPARTYTAEGTVGIGGVYMCIYGMDSPGGYQLVGRTLPIWNKFLTNPIFVGGKPWLLRFFDQVRFHPVEEAELLELRDGFRTGRTSIKITEEVFDLGEYNRFLTSIEHELTTFKSRQKAAFDIEVAHWKAEEEAAASSGLTTAANEAADEGELDGHVVSADISGSVWKLLVDAGATVAAGDAILIVEAMKMEFAVHAPVAGRISSLRCKQGSLITAGDALAVIEVA